MSRRADIPKTSPAVPTSAATSVVQSKSGNNVSSSPKNFLDGKNKMKIGVVVLVALVAAVFLVKTIKKSRKKPEPEVTEEVAPPPQQWKTNFEAPPNPRPMPMARHHHMAPPPAPVRHVSSPPPPSTPQVSPGVKMRPAPRNVSMPPSDNGGVGGSIQTIRPESTRPEREESVNGMPPADSSPPPPSSDAPPPSNPPPPPPPPPLPKVDGSDMTAI